MCPAGGGVSDEGRARLELVARVDDGFRLAEADLAQRGFGELLGTRQAGAPSLQLADLAELAALTRTARVEAERILAEDPGLARPEHDLLAAAARARMDTMFGAEAG